MLGLGLMNPITEAGRLTQWVTNLNGVNSEGEMIPWGDKTDLTIEMEVYVAQGNDSKYLLDGREEGGAGSGFLYFNADGSQLINRYGGQLEINGEVTTTIGTGYHHIRITGGSGSVRKIGSRWYGKPFKGQIYNLVLTDNLNQSKSRSFVDVIDSVRMPVGSVLSDRLSQPPLFYQCEDYWTDRNDPDNINWVAGISGNVTEQNLTLRFINDGGQLMFPPGARLSANGNYLDVYKGGQNQPKHTPAVNHTSTDKWAIREKFMYPNRMTTNAHGTDAVLFNLGADCPWVPKLEARKAYCGSRTDDLFTGGIWVENASSSDLSKIGLPECSIALQAGDKLIAWNGSQLYVRSVGSTVVKCNNISGSVNDIVEGFAYPNTFMVVQPDDPDYGDYP